MKAIGGHIGALGSMAKGEVSFTDEAVLQPIPSRHEPESLTPVPEGSGYEVDKKTNDLPALWERWDDFQAAVKALQDEGARIVTVAEAGDVTPSGNRSGRSAGMAVATALIPSGTNKSEL